MSMEVPRIVHIQGGCRVINFGNGPVELHPVASNGKIASFSGISHHGLIGYLAHAGYGVIGADFFTTPEQVDGRQLPEWRAYLATASAIWPALDQADKFSFVAHGAIKQKNGVLWDVAHRIAYQLRTCRWRLRQISDAYHQQVNAYVRAKSFESGVRRNDQFTWLGYLAIQSFLTDACTLRDYFAEYRALILVQAGLLPGNPRITKMASLKSRYLSRSATHAPVDTHLEEATAPGGWLFELGSLRDLAVHVSPLANADKTLYAVCQAIPIDPQATLPSIKLPIPTDASKIAAARHTGEHFEDPSLEFARFSNALKDPGAALDGLEYSHASLRQLDSLANELSLLSPVVPEMPHLTEADIIDLKIVNNAAP